MFKSCGNSYSKSIWSSDHEEIDDCRQRHVEGDEVRDVPENSSGRLWNWIDCVEDRMQDSCDSDDPKEPTRHSDMRLGENEQESDDRERHNVLQIIEMRSSHSLNVFMRFHFKVFAQHAILRRDHCLVLAPLVHRQQAHCERFEQQNSAPCR